MDMLAATNPEAWLTGASVLGLAMTIAGLAKWGFAKFEALTMRRVSDLEAQILHREALLEKVLGVLTEHNATAAHTVRLIREIREISGGRHPRPDAQDGGP